MEKHGHTYQSITKIAISLGGDDSQSFINDWLMQQETIERLALFECFKSERFNVDAFEEIRGAAILNDGKLPEKLSAKEWIKKTKAIFLVIQRGEIYAHNEIAFDFANWIKNRCRYGL